MSVQISVQTLAQDVSSQQADVLSEQDQIEQSEQDILIEDNSSAGSEVSQRSSVEPSPEDFNPTEEIVDDTAVSFPVDI